MLKLLRYFLTIAILLFVLTFALLNSNKVEFSYYTGITQIPLSLLLIMAFMAGCIFTLIMMLTWYWRMRWETHKLAKKLSLTEKELANLRTMPLKNLT